MQSHLINGLPKLNRFLKANYNSWNFFYDHERIALFESLKPEDFDLYVNSNRSHGESDIDYLHRLSHLEKQLKETQNNLGKSLTGFSQFKFSGKNTAEVSEDQIRKFNDHCDALITKMQNVSETIASQIEVISEIQSKLKSKQGKSELKVSRDEKEINFAPKPNTVTLRKFCRTEPDQERQQIMGIFSDEHISLDICLADGRRVYVSLYTQPNAEPLETSSVRPLTDALHMPSNEIKAGQFRSDKHDWNRVNKTSKNKKEHYHTLEEITFDCSENNKYRLDIKKMYDWAEKLLKDYSKKPYPYKIYSNDNTTDNCATICLKGLGQGLQNVNTMPQFKRNIILAPAPSQIFEYGQLAEKQLQALNFEEKIIYGEGLEEQALFVEIINLAIKNIDVYILNEKLELSKQKDLLKSGNKEEIIELQINPQEPSFLNLLTKTEDILKKLVDDLAKTKSIDKSIEFTDKAINTLTEKLDQQAELLPNKRNEIEEIQKLLTKTRKLLPTRTNIFLNAINLRIKGHLNTKENVTNDKINKIKTKVEEIFKDNSVNLTKDIDATLFHKSLMIKDTIIELQKEVKKELQANPQDKNFIKFAKNMLIQLRDIYGEVNQFLFFDRNDKGINNDKNEFLTHLKEILPEFHKETGNLNMTVYRAKQYFQPKNQDFKNKPSVFNLFRMSERHHLFKEDTKDKIFELLNNNKTSYQEKIEYINDLIAERKPSSWKFWRSKERAEYETLAQEATLVCLIDGFSRGQMEMRHLIIALEKLTYAFPENKKEQLTSFIVRMKHYLNTVHQQHEDQYNGELASRMEKTLGSYANQLATFIKQNGHTPVLKKAMKTLEPFLPSQNKTAPVSVAVPVANLDLPQKSVKELNDVLYRVESRFRVR